MKLTPALVEKTLNQFEAQAIPDDHPVVSQLNNAFGDHTFFVASNGLHIVEPVEPAGEAIASGQVVKLANWSDANRTGLVPHEPEPTDIIILLAA